MAVTGEVDNAEAKRAALEAAAKFGPVRDEITVLPTASLGEKTWGITSVSVLNAREKMGNAAEMGTQILMGNAFRIWQVKSNWFQVQSSDRYLGWTEGGSFVAVTEAEVRNWNDGPLLIVTALEDRILEKPDPSAQEVSDVVLCDLVKRVGESGDWAQVALPDGRGGYLRRDSVEDYGTWQKERRPTPENIERTAKSFLGRPYFWGCNTPRGMDCSGFTKLVYFLNGVALDRNASQQARQGIEIPVDPEYSQLKKGDLLFFGRRGTKNSPEKVDHVAIYLGNRDFIQSSGRVKINSLDPKSEIADPRRIRRLLHVRRVLAE